MVTFLEGDIPSGRAELNILFGRTWLGEPTCPDKELSNTTEWRTA